MTIDSDLTGALPVDATALAALHRRLERDSADLVEVAYRILESPVGDLLVATTERGLVRVAFAGQDFDRVLDQLAAGVSPRLLNSPGRLDAAAGQLQQYFTGARHQFELPLDHRLSQGFGAQVHAYLPRIGYGERASYAEVAAGVGNPRAVRAVGTACARNPLPIVVPCHRVVKADGSTGQYAGGAQAKTWLLGLEQAG